MATQIDDGDAVCYEMDCALSAPVTPLLSDSLFASRMRCQEAYKSSFFMNDDECSDRRNLQVDENFDLWQISEYDSELKYDPVFYFINPFTFRTVRNCEDEGAHLTNPVDIPLKFNCSDGSYGTFLTPFMPYPQ
jgi:hypothetical protein